MLFGLAMLLFGGVDTVAANALVERIDIDPLEEAQVAYQAGDYGHVVTLANKKLDQKNLSPLDQVAAFRLLALAHTAQGRTAEARKAADNLIRLYPTYEPVDDDPVAFGNLIEDSRQRYAEGKLARTKKKGGVPQFVYNTIAVVASVAVIYVGAKSASDM